MVKIQEYDMNACAKQKIGEHRNFANLGVWFTGIEKHRNPNKYVKIQTT